MPAAKAKTTVRQRQRLETRGQILEAAIDSFARAGFEAASLGEIARGAGVKKALVQYHFTTKEQLWKEAARQIWTERNQQLAAFIAERDTGNYEESLRGGFTALVQFTRARPQWLQPRIYILTTLVRGINFARGFSLRSHPRL